jgi:UDP-glucose 4-epimerase
LTVEDAAESHVEALKRAPELGFGTFIISATTSFSPEDCEELIRDAPSVVRRYFPQYPALYAQMGWTMFQSIDRVYDSNKARQRLGFACRSGFGEKLKELETQLAAQI